MVKSKHLIQCLLFVLIALPFAGCDPVTEDGNYVEPISLYEKIGGSWNLSDLVMIDEAPLNGWLTNLEGSPNQQREASPKTEISMNGALNFDHFVMHLNTDEQFNPTTYSVETEALPFIPTEGYWELNNRFTDPTGKSPVILIYSDAAKTQKIAEYTLSVVPGANKEMEFKITRFNKGKAYLSYVYKFIK